MPSQQTRHPLSIFEGARHWRRVLSSGDHLMSARHRQAVLLTLLLLSGLSGCAGNYKFNDNLYRPLGDPQAANRGY